MTDEQTKNFTIMQEDIKHIKEDLGEIKEAVKTFMENSEKKFAGKWVEKVLWGLGGIVGTVVVVAILKLVIIK